MVVGGGIVGLATARAVLLANPGRRVVVLEKEDRLAAHQTGHNSGVIHSGIYYAPGSLKARFAIAGSRSMVAYARHKEIAVEVTGKLIVATRPDELPRLEALHRRGVDHGLAVSMLDASEAREREPHVAAIAALHVGSTGIVDFPAVAQAMAQDVLDAGGEIRTGMRVVSIRPGTYRQLVLGDDSTLDAARVVNCAGLQSDLVAKAAGVDPGARIVPFRGEYHELTPEARHLVRGLIYPVPDPDFPFLGVHLTRGIDGGVHAGPNAVLALSREGYRWRDISISETLSVLSHRGFRSLARRHLAQGLDEMKRSVWRPMFVRELQRLVPEIADRHLVRAPAGVRAQALDDDGALVDDFLIRPEPAPDGSTSTLHVLNAPSPAATASLEIGSELARRLAF